MTMEKSHPGVEIKLTGEPVLDADTIITSTSDTEKALGITVTLIIILFSSVTGLSCAPRSSFLS